jgi:glycosyltransferase involved in cell wall biosynthesis
MPESAAFAFTLFTPTYNRARTLPRVWESLKKQTFRDFEWLVIDDGSTDGTEELVAGYLREAPFPIRYIKQANQHKKVAFNRAVKEARGELVLYLDSDDGCVPEALERLWWHWQNIPADQRQGFSAITVLCKDEDGNIIGDRFPGGEWVDSTSSEITHRWKVRGEKWGFHRTDVLRQFPFPEDVRGYVPECYVWMQVDHQYKTRFVNEPLRLYYRDQDDSLMTTGAKDPRPSADGGLLGSAVELRECIRWFRYDARQLCKLAANMVRLALHSTLPRERIWRAMWTDQPLAARLLLLAVAPVGLAVYCLDRWRLRATARKGTPGC